MKKEYDLKKLKKRPEKVKVDVEATKIPTSIRLDAIVVADLRTEAERLGIPYQTLISSVLFRYVSGEFIDKHTFEVAKILKNAS